MGAGRIFAYSPDISKAFEAGENIIRLLMRKPLIDSDSKDGKLVTTVGGELEFKNVYFNYPTRPHVKVLQGLSLIVKPGHYVAFGISFFSF